MADGSFTAITKGNGTRHPLQSKTTNLKDHNASVVSKAKQQQVWLLQLACSSNCFGFTVPILVRDFCGRV